MATSIWKKFVCSRTQLCLDTVLVCGQSFRWKQNNQGEWLGVMANLVWRMKQTDNCILYQVYGPENTSQASAKSDGAKGPQGQFENGKTYCCKNENLMQNEEVPQTKTGCADIKMENNSTTRLDNIKTEIFTHETVDCNSETCTRGVRKRPNNCISRGVGKARKTRSATGNSHNDKLVLDSFSHPVTARKVREEEEIQDNNFKLTNCLPVASGDKEESDGSLDQKHLNLLHDYFQLDVDLSELYSHWSSKDPHFQKVAGNFHGIRILRQDPVENLLSFVCSSNNHISRITSMIEKLCIHYGDYIITVDDVAYHAFPTLSSLCGDNVELHLRELGFGYRAKFIASIAKHVTQEKGEEWVGSLRQKSYPEAKTELMTLLGVGAKVADCVCLMSLDKPGALPVDTHVWQITMKNYMAKLQSAKSLTEKLYNEIGDFYRKLWGPYAGWAHSVLFTADLRHNKDRRKGGNASATQQAMDENKPKEIKHSTTDTKLLVHSQTEKMRKKRKLHE